MQTLDKHFRALTKLAFEARGFAQADVLSSWASVVGAELATLATPERIHWPAKGQKSGGTLYLLVPAAFRLDVEYQAPVIIEKVNGFLGFAAVAKIRVKLAQAQLLPKPQSAAPGIVPPALVARLSAITEPALQAALSRLAVAVAADHATSPQAELRHSLHTPNASRNPK